MDTIMAKKIILLVSVVVFVLSAFGVTFGTVQLIPLGLALLAGALLL